MRPTVTPRWRPRLRRCAATPGAGSWTPPSGPWPRSGSPGSRWRTSPARPACPARASTGTSTRRTPWSPSSSSARRRRSWPGPAPRTPTTTTSSPPIEDSVLFCLQLARRHPLLDRLLASEPEILLPYLTTRGGGVLEHARAVMEELASAWPGVDALAGAPRRRPGRSRDPVLRPHPARRPARDRGREIARILSKALQETKEARR